MSIFQCPKLTTVDAVATDHAAQGIYGVRLIVDAGSLTVLRTQRAVLALVHIEVHLQPRELGKDAQRSTHGTDGVAIRATIAPGEQSLAVVVLSNGCQHVVASHPYRL